MDNKKQFIFAGTYQQARDWMRVNNKNPNDWVYINSAERLRGYENCNYIRYGTWYERKDSWEIEEMLASRGFKEITL
jgi:hypothetical protein